MNEINRPERALQDSPGQATKAIAEERRPGLRNAPRDLTLKGSGNVRAGFAAPLQGANQLRSQTQGGARSAHLPWAVPPCTFGAAPVCGVLASVMFHGSDQR